MAPRKRTPETASLKESTSTLRGGGTMDERIRGWREELRGFEQERGTVGDDNIEEARKALEALVDSASAFQSSTIDNHSQARSDLEEKWSRLERIFSRNRRALSGRSWPLV